MFLVQYMCVNSEMLESIMSGLLNHIIQFIGDQDIETCLRKKNIINTSLLENGDSIFLQIAEYNIVQWKILITIII